MKQPQFKNSLQILVQIAFIFCLFQKVETSEMICSSDQSLHQMFSPSNSASPKILIGGGSFGQVYSDGLFVLKKMLIKPGEEFMRELMNREIQYMNIFKNTYDIIGIQDNMCYVNGNQYQIMIDFMMSDLEKMFSQINQAFNGKQLDFWKMDMFFKMALALKKLHSFKVLHRDIKPPNIFMMNILTPILADLGFANIKGADQLVLGSNPYIGYTYVNNQYQLEQLSRDEKDDIYALGITTIALFNQQSITVPTMGKQFKQTNNPTLTKFYNEVLRQMTGSNRSINPRAVQSLDNILFSAQKVIQNFYEENKEICEDYFDKEKELYEFLINPNQSIPRLNFSIQDQVISSTRHSHKLLSQFEKRKLIYTTVTSQANLNSDLNSYIQEQTTTVDFKIAGSLSAALRSNLQAQYSQDHNLKVQRKQQVKNGLLIQQQLLQKQREQVNQQQNQEQQQYVRENNFQQQRNERVNPTPRINTFDQQPPNKIAQLKRNWTQQKDKQKIAGIQLANQVVKNNIDIQPQNIAIQKPPQQQKQYIKQPIARQETHTRQQFIPQHPYNRQQTNQVHFSPPQQNFIQAPLYNQMVLNTPQYNQNYPPQILVRGYRRLEKKKGNKILI